jgi:hypothetical protein
MDTTLNMIAVSQMQDLVLGINNVVRSLIAGNIFTSRYISYVLDSIHISNIDEKRHVCWP